jgi:SPP1 family phage portal protein
MANGFNKNTYDFQGEVGVELYHRDTDGDDLLYWYATPKLYITKWDTEAVLGHIEALSATYATLSTLYKGFVGQSSKHFIVRNYAKYIVDFQTSFIAGKSVTIDSKDEQIRKIVNDNDFASLDPSVVKQLLLYGSAYTLNRRVEGTLTTRETTSPDKYVTEIIEPNNAWTVHTVDGEYNVYTSIIDDGYNIIAPDMVVYHADEELNNWTAIPNVDGRLLLTRYELEDSRSSLASVISLLLTLDHVEQQAVGYLDKLALSTRVIAGDFGGEKLNTQQTQELGGVDVVLLNSGVTVDGKQSVSSMYEVTPTYDVEAVETIKQSLRTDIFRLSGVPDFYSSRFHADMTATEIKALYMDLIQLASGVTRQYLKGIYKRMQQLVLLNGGVFNTDTLDINFHYSFPDSTIQDMVALYSAGAYFTQEQLHEQLDADDNPQENAKRAMEEHAKDWISDDVLVNAYEDENRLVTAEDKKARASQIYEQINDDTETDHNSIID